ncbi:hypothetical protein [Kitasatospora sp. NPDC085879]|uniref:hypothetical protein n=1 Tax=Kitasatospora sp. NPDC085879 TaxID=3154769 RepID=UPI003426DFEE
MDDAGPHLRLIAAGAALVVALVLAFVLGQRRKDKEPPPLDLRHEDGGADAERRDGPA